jgi:hypothetical protein
MGFKVVVNSASKNRVSVNTQQKQTIGFVQTSSDSNTESAISVYAPMSYGSVINTDGKNRVSLNSRKKETVRFIRTSATSRLDSLLDVDSSDADNNEVLVFDAVSGKYVVKVLPILDGGSF